MRWMRRCGLVGLVLVAGIGFAAVGGGAGLEGDWRTPTGSVIRVAGCGSDVCAKIVTVEKSAPGTLDENNPDKALRGRSLCGLEVGSGFKREDATHATGGTLYDPNSGRTYRGLMTVSGDQMKLRGYIGVSLFGRTEVWKRLSVPAVAPAGGDCRV